MTKILTFWPVIEKVPPDELSQPGTPKKMFCFFLTNWNAQQRTPYSHISMSLFLLIRRIFIPDW